MTKQQRTNVGWSRDAQDAAERASPPPSPEELASDRGARHVGQSELLSSLSLPSLFRSDSWRSLGL